MRGAATLSGWLAAAMIGLAACSAPVAAPPAAATKPPGAPPTAASAPAAAAAQPTAAQAAPAVPAAAASAAPAAPDVVRIGVTGAFTEGANYIARERGYFAELNLEAAYERFDAAARMVPALAADQLDVAAGGVNAGLLNATARDVPFRIAGPMSRHDPGLTTFHFVARRDLAGALQDYRDLRGKTIALAASQGTISDYILDGALKRGGLAWGDVNVVDMGFADMNAAFANGAIDLGIQAEPLPTIAVERGLAVKWREVADVYPGVQATVILYGPHFATQRTDAAQRFMQAYLRAARDYLDAFTAGRNRAEIVDILTRYTSATDPALYDKMGAAYLDPDGRLNLDSLRDQMRYFRERGFLTVEPDLAQVIDTRFVDYALARLGPYQRP